MLPGVADGTRIRFPVDAYLIETDTGELVLVDTGMNDGHVADPRRTWRGTGNDDFILPVMTETDTLSTRLKDLGIRHEDIQVLINTHLHFDHAGNNLLFPNAKVFVQQDHLDVIHERPSSFPAQYLGSESRFVVLDGDHQVFPGITVLKSPGHEPGHQSVWVDLSIDPGMLLAGDAIQSRSNIDLDNWGAYRAPAQSRATATYLLDYAAARRGVTIFAHDAEQSHSLRASPAFYS